MTSDLLLEAARRRWTDSDIQFDVTESERGMMLVARSGPQPSPALGRLYLERESGTVFVVPTYIRDDLDMDEVVADPAKRAGLTLA